MLYAILYLLCCCINFSARGPNPLRNHFLLHGRPRSVGVGVREISLKLAQSIINDMWHYEVNLIVCLLNWQVFYGLGYSPADSRYGTIAWIVYCLQCYGCCHYQRNNRCCHSFLHAPWFESPTNWFSFFIIVISSLFDLAETLLVDFYCALFFPGGYYVSTDGVLNWLAWIKYLSFIYWGYCALIINEFGDGRLRVNC